MGPKHPSKAEAEARRKTRIRDLIKALGAVLPKKLLGSNSQTHVLEVALQYIGELKLRLSQYKYGDEDITRDACLRNAESELLSAKNTLERYERVLDIVGIPKNTEPDILTSCGLSSYSRRKYVAEHGSLPKAALSQQPALVFLVNQSPAKRAVPVLPKKGTQPETAACSTSANSEVQTESAELCDAVCQTQKSSLLWPSIDAGLQCDVHQKVCVAVQTEPINVGSRQSQAPAAPACDRFLINAAPSVSIQPNPERAAPLPPPHRTREQDSRNNQHLASHLIASSRSLAPAQAPQCSAPLVTPVSAKSISQQDSGILAKSGTTTTRQPSSRICEELPHFSFFANNSTASSGLNQAYKRSNVADPWAAFPAGRPMDLTESGPQSKNARQEKRTDARVAQTSGVQQQQYGQFSVNYLHLTHNEPSTSTSQRQPANSAKDKNYSVPYHHLLNPATTWNVQGTSSTGFHHSVPPAPDPNTAGAPPGSVFFSPSKPYLSSISSLTGSAGKSASGLMPEGCSGSSWPNSNPTLGQVSSEQFYPPHEWANDFQWQLSAAAAAFDPPTYSSGLPAATGLDESGSRSKFTPYYNCYTLPGDPVGPDRGQQKKQSFQIAHMLGNNGGNTDFSFPT